MAITDFRGEYRWLSNFSYVVCVWGNKYYKTIEHAYQAAKTDIEKEIEWVRDAPSPGIARRRGQKVTIREDWDSKKLLVMTRLLHQKFEPEGSYRDLLLDTGNQHLVEGNTWGILSGE